MSAAEVSLAVNWWEVDEPWLPYGEVVDVVTDRAVVAAVESGGEIATPTPPEMLPEVGRPPASDPFAEVAELLSPPALAEPSEYMDEDDILLWSASVVPRGLKAASGRDA